MASASFASTGNEHRGALLTLRTLASVPGVGGYSAQNRTL